MNKLILGLAMIVSLAVPGAFITSIALNHDSGSSSQTPDNSNAPKDDSGGSYSLPNSVETGTTPSVSPYLGVANRELVDDVNNLFALHDRIVKQTNASGSPNPGDAARVSAIAKKLVRWKKTYGGLDSVSDRLATASARFASAFVSLLDDPQSEDAYTKYRSAHKAVQAAITAARSASG